MLILIHCIVFCLIFSVTVAFGEEGLIGAEPLHLSQHALGKCVSGRHVSKYFRMMDRLKDFKVFFY